MSVYVLLEFDDDTKARALLDILLDKPRKQVLSIKDAKPRAVFKKPTKFCECGNTRDGGFTRGRKYGWWVHAKCGKPTKAWAKGDFWYEALGTNLLPPDIAPEHRPMGWESTAQWDVSNNVE